VYRRPRKANGRQTYLTPSVPLGLLCSREGLIAAAAAAAAAAASASWAASFACCCAFSAAVCWLIESTCSWNWLRALSMASAMLASCASAPESRPSGTR